MFSRFFISPTICHPLGASSLIRNLHPIGLVALAALTVGCDSNAANGIKKVDGVSGPDNIIIKESFVLARPDIVTAAFNKSVDELCPDLPHVSQADVEQMYARSIETYISGRSKTVVKKGFAARGNDDPCNSLGVRIESVSINKPKVGIIVNRRDAKVNVEIEDFSGDPYFDTGFERALKSYPGRVKTWQGVEYTNKERVFGYECGYSKSVPGASCTLLPNPVVVAFRDLLVLKAAPHKSMPGCEGSVAEALQNVPVLSLSGKCVGDMVHTIDSFKMNVGMPTGIFEIPAYARDVKPVVKVIK